MSEEHYGRSTEARARRRRAVITVGLALLMVFFAGWYSMSYIRADEASRSATSSSTSEPPACDLDPSQVEVNVYNATDREGLAGRVAGDLKKRGFVVRTVANDPKQVEVTGRGQLRHGPNGSQGSQLVARHEGTVEDDPDDRERAAVDLVLGPDYQHLVDEDRAKAC